ncbi:methyltransferase family protein [Pseudomonas sp. GM84]|uniref:class I SAM-dependent methyltransferase n=1 Tax=Pseudomonas sp. GM84 TaxID=1144340 RepID=UPI00026F4CD2|nr:class I SAM-dependent methyltransferase [Pseudomonas sp. GM84]EJN39656.1 methyltransferase family protein [Pseudomonas sp. GM84]
MNNPWLTIPLSDYEGHMALPEVGQAEMLAGELKTLLSIHSPRSVALIGCAGGNGFVQAAEARLTRLVGIDINESYIEDSRRRYADIIPGLELHCADIAGDVPKMEAVDFVYAALIFEYVDVTAALRNIAMLCRPNGLLAVLLQLPKQGAEAVTPSPFTSLKELGSIMRLVPPGKFNESAVHQGFSCMAQKTISLQSGKQFSLQLFRLISTRPQGDETNGAAGKHEAA